MNRGDKQLHSEHTFAHALCEYIGVDDLSLVGMLQGAAAVAWRPFRPYLSLYYLDTSDDECMNE